MQHQSRFKTMSLLTLSLLTASVTSQGVGATPFDPLRFIPFENDNSLSVALQRLPRVALHRPELFASQFTLRLNNPWFHTAKVQLHSGSSNEQVAFEGYGRRAFHSGLLFEYGAVYQSSYGRKCSAVSAALLTPKLAVSATQLLPLNGFEKRTPDSMHKVRGAKSITMKVGYRSSLLNGLKVHTEIGQFYDKEIRLNSGALRSRLKLMAAATYQPNAIASIKYQVSRINAAVYDHQIRVKLSIPLATLSLTQFGKAHYSASESEVQETIRGALAEEQETYAVGLESALYYRGDSEPEESDIEEAMSTTESLQPAQDSIASWISEIQTVFSEELAKYSTGEALHTIVENVVNKVESLEEIIPKLLGVESPAVPGQYGDFCKPDNCLSTFVPRITASICSLLYYSLAEDDAAETRLIPRYDITEHLDQLLNLFSYWNFSFVEKNIITREDVIRFCETFEPATATGEVGGVASQSDREALALLTYKYTDLVYKNIFLGPEYNLFELTKLRVDDYEYINDFCKKQILFLGKRILVPGLKNIRLISNIPLAINMLNEKFGIEDDGKTSKTIQTFTQRLLSSSAQERHEGLSDYISYASWENVVEGQIKLKGLKDVSKEMFKERRDKEQERIKKLSSALPFLESANSQLNELKGKTKDIRRRFKHQKSEDPKKDEQVERLLNKALEAEANCKHLNEEADSILQEYQGKEEPARSDELKGIFHFISAKAANKKKTDSEA